MPVAEFSATGIFFGRNDGADGETINRKILDQYRKLARRRPAYGVRREIPAARTPAGRHPHHGCTREFLFPRRDLRGHQRHFERAAEFLQPLNVNKKHIIIFRACHGFFRGRRFFCALLL